MFEDIADFKEEEEVGRVQIPDLRFILFFISFPFFFFVLIFLFHLSLGLSGDQRMKCNNAFLTIPNFFYYLQGIVLHLHSFSFFLF